MVNLKSLFAIMSVFCLLFVLLGLIQLGMDVVIYFRASKSSTSLDYRGVHLMVIGLASSGGFLALFFRRKY
jgi:hypothetical protein